MNDSRITYNITIHNTTSTSEKLLGISTEKIHTIVRFPYIGKSAFLYFIFCSVFIFLNIEPAIHIGLFVSPHRYRLRKMYVLLSIQLVKYI